jgi:hypothetical protein
MLQQCWLLAVNEQLFEIGVQHAPLGKKKKVTTTQFPPLGVHCRLSD